MDEERTYSLNVQIAQLLDPEFDYAAESVTDTERYRRLVRDYEHDLNAVVDVLPEDMELSLSKQGDFFHVGIEPLIYGLVATGWGHAGRISYADSAARALLALLAPEGSEPR